MEQKNGDGRRRTMRRTMRLSITHSSLIFIAVRRLWSSVMDPRWVSSSMTIFGVVRRYSFMESKEWEPFRCGESSRLSRGFGQVFYWFR